MLYIVGAISFFSPCWRKVLASFSSVCYNSHWVFIHSV